MFNIGDRFIIEISSCETGIDHSNHIYKIKGLNRLLINEETLASLETFKGHVDYQKGYKEGYNKGFYECQQIRFNELFTASERAKSANDALEQLIDATIITNNK